MPIAGPSAPIQGRVDWKQRLEQSFQVQHNQQLQNHSHVLPDQTHCVIIESQQVMGQQERYVEEEHSHAAHLAELYQQHEEQREREHLADLADVQRLHREQRNRELEREQVTHLANLAEMKLLSGEQ